MDHIQIETEAVILLLVIAVAVALFARRLGIPYIIAIVIVGAFSKTTGLFTSKAIVLSRDLLLCVFLPPLLFEGSMRFCLRDLLENIVGVAGFAGVGMLIATGVTGLLTYLLISATGVGDLGSGMTGILVGLLFGALISATDPLSVIALFKQLGAPNRLKVLVEGESIFNDGVAIVLFGVVLDILRGTQATTGLLGPILTFAKLSAGGMAIGLALGALSAWVSQRADEDMVGITLTIILAYSSYFIAEYFDVSGVMAVIGAGLLSGNYVERATLAPRTRFSLNMFWDFTAFLANSLVFLLVGLRIDLLTLASHWAPVVIAILVILVARVALVYPIAAIVGYLTKPIPVSWRHIMLWSGLRGGIAMVLGLSLIHCTNDRFTPEMASLLQSMTFGVVLFTIVAQGLTIAPLLKRLGLVGQSQPLDSKRVAAFLKVLRAIEDILNRLYVEKRISRHAFDILWAEYALRLQEYEQEIQTEPAQLSDEEMRIREALIEINRDLLSEQLETGAISGETIEGILHRLDLQTAPGAKPR